MKRHAILISTSLLVGVVIASGGEARSQDWAEWRGPNRDGVVKNFVSPGSWPKGLAQKWKVIVGGGYSSPVVSGSRIYLHTRQDEMEVVSCFDHKTGKTIWSKSYAATFSKNQYAVKMGKGPNSTPIVYAGSVYTLGVNAVLSCFDAKSGELKWRKDFSTQIDTSKLFCGTAMSPVIEKGLVIIHVGDDRKGSVIAFDASTGKQQWDWQGDGPGYSSPIVVEIGGARQFVTLTDKAIVGIATDSGKLLWSMPFPDEWNENIVTPVLYRNTLIVSAVRKGTMAIEVVKSENGWSTRQAWHNPQVAMYMSSPVLDGDYLYGMSSLRKGQYFCINAKTGALLWATDGREGRNASVLGAGDVLMFLTEDAQLIIARKSPKGFDRVANYTVANAATWAHPVVSGKNILVKDEAALTLWSIE